jgi:hypothetical protein
VVGIAGRDRLAAPPCEDGLRTDALTDAEHVGLGQVDRADPEVGAGVLDARGRDRRRPRDELGSPLPGQRTPADEAGAGDLDDITRQCVHDGSGREVPRRRHPVEVARVEGDQAAGRVEDIDDGGILGIGVPDRCGDHRRHSELRGQREHPTGLSEAAGQVLGTTVADDLDDEPVPRQQLAPPLESGPGEGLLPGEHCTADVRVRAEEHDQPGRLGISSGPGVRSRSCPHRTGSAGNPGSPGVLGEQACGDHRVAAFAAQVGVRDETAERGPSGARGQAGAAPSGQDGHPGQTRVDEGATSHRGSPACGAASSSALRSGIATRLDRVRAEGKVDPEDRADSPLHAGGDELDRAVEPVAVGEGKRRLTEGDGPLDELLRLGRAVSHRVARCDVQVDEAVGHRTGGAPRSGVVSSGSGTVIGTPRMPWTISRNISA